MILPFVRLLLLLVIVFAVTACQSPRIKNVPTTSSNAYDRVLSAGMIRCGYLTYRPYCMKDPNTLWPNANRARAADFSIPIFYSAFKAYGRTGDNRFQGNLKAINSPQITIAVLDGAMEDLITKSDFPLAKRLSLPQLSPFSQNLLNIITNKADVTFAEPGITKLFLKSNPNTIKELAPNQPLQIFGNTYAFKIGEITFKNMINTVLDELLNSGEIEKLIKNMNKLPEHFIA